MRRITPFVMLPLLIAGVCDVMGVPRLAGVAQAAEENVSSRAVQEAIDRGKAFLFSKQQEDGSWGDTSGGLNVEGNDRKIGLAGLATYALLAGGETVQDARIKKALDFMDQKTLWTYALAFRTQAFLEAYHQNPQYRRALTQDANLLIKMAADSKKKAPGSYEYRAGVGLQGDLSNSQYGLLGVWAAERANAEIPNGYWEAVMKYWVDTQRKDGGWSYKYRDGEASGGTMTAAGIASLFVCVDALYANRFVSCGKNPEIPPIRNGLEWFEKNFSTAMKDEDVQHRGHGDMYYFLFGVERIGLASGYKYFGTEDWYQAGARWLLKNQSDDGSWRGKWGSSVGTAYALLFLIRGQQPVIVNRLEYDGDWNNRPRAIASLCRWARNSFESDVNWQIVNLKNPPEDWHDAPLLMITGSNKPQFSDEDLDKLRTFVHQGGTLISLTECNKDRVFGKAIREAYARLFPDYKLQPVPRDHPFYNIHAKLNARSKLEMIHNGVRPLVIHTDEDLVKSWQLAQFSTHRADFDPIANILIYITGHQFRNRGSMDWPATPTEMPKEPAVTVVRVKHTGNWNPEPLAMERFRRMMGRQQYANIQLGDPVDLDALGQCKADLAVMTGTDALKLTDEQLAAMKAYGESGGTLMIDAAHGNDAFYNTVYDALNRTFGQDLALLPVDSPVYIHGGTNVGEITLRGNMVGGVQRGRPKLEAVTLNKRAAIILSRHDLTGGLLGVRVIDCEGYAPDSAFDVVRNIALYASGAAPQEWKGQDIGSVGKAGIATVSEGTITVKASGSDIWETSDEFHFVPRTRQAFGNVTITARLASVDDVHEWAKAGLMIRESLAPDARHVMIAVTPSNGVSLVSRTKTGGQSASKRGGGKAPYWVRLQRDGNNFTGYASSDGKEWTEIGSVTIPMASSVYVGPALTSHKNDTICTATFDNVTVED